MANTVHDFLERLDAVERRLSDHAASEQHAGLTTPDARTGERWDAGQIWAHLGEFLPYWIDQAHTVVSSWRVEPVPFGRVKSDPHRVAIIERDRLRAPDELMDQISAGIAATRSFLTNLPPDAWRAIGRHQTLGDMPLERIVDEFMVGHLEEHAEQLDELTRKTPRF
ncbi:MAG TPA: DinB family protein [Chloroflexota bacterium]|nr:DinB family protein [Chloroflexota bacterium]